MPATYQAHEPWFLSDTNTINTHSLISSPPQDRQCVCTDCECLAFSLTSKLWDGWKIGSCLRILCCLWDNSWFIWEMTSYEGLCKENSEVWCCLWLLYCITYLCSKSCTLCICSGRLQIGLLPKEDDVMFYFFSPFPLMNWILFSDWDVSYGRPNLYRWVSFLDKQWYTTAFILSNHVSHM